MPRSPAADEIDTPDQEIRDCEDQEPLPASLMGAVGAALVDGAAGKTQNLERDLRIVGAMLRCPRPSLTEVARAEGLTDERVRQLWVRISRNCQASGRRPAGLVQALESLERENPMTFGEACF
ncbi:hypothetical protein SAE02_61400 [Skermanella aerolata]|uniref:Uncharacterized protein n=1 Tax=Skermanella aerolata TaxID=393310 RepID=A0A512DZW9_9PROT|nr:hypothetical protein [Skermanella aerolata]KJB91901.1 hypothetical protein N826_25630 [Skermanella aerolata KACC 11604]GEO41992.1 hypothetical protein SAE02_61400 [Skermanella aerolata]